MMNDSPTRTVIYSSGGRRTVLVDVVAVVAHDLMRYHEVTPADHPAAARELQDLVAAELLDLGREVLARHGLLGGNR